MIRFHRAGWWDHSHSLYSSLYFLTGLKYSWWKKMQDQRSVAEGKVIALFRIPPEWPHFLDDTCQLFMFLTNHITSHLRCLLSSCLRKGRHKDTQTQPLPSGGLSVEQRHEKRNQNKRSLFIQGITRWSLSTCTWDLVPNDSFGKEK